MAPSFLHRVIRAINIAIGAAAAVIAAAVWWYGVRPLPRTSGTIEAPVAAPVTVARDALGVPHIRAANLDDLLFAQGYVTAQDRLFQMDGLRRLSGGTLAEIIGPAGLQSDRESRGLRIRRVAEAGYTSLGAADRAALGAYTRGVNWFIRTHLDKLPLEFTLLDYQPRPWSGVDTLLVGLHMMRILSTTWREELAKRGMMLAGDARKVDFLFPWRGGTETALGSNAWAIAGALTASGHPLLSNDMHLDWALPGIWYMAHLQAPGLDAAGVSLPGMVGVIVGHNQRIAWGITNLHFDVQDLYLEKFDDRTGRYLYRGQTEQARQEREIIQVKGAAPVEMLVWVTRHGPLFVSEGTDRIALRWVAAEPGALEVPILAIDQAQNWQEFTAALSRFRGPASNFAYADVDGNIGYHAAGWMPIRRNYRGDVPVDGSTGEFEWDGYIPFAELPQSFNPPGGVIVTANNDPFPADYPYHVGGDFAPGYRARQIRDLLRSRRGWKAEDLLAVQMDVYSGFSRFLAQQMVAAYRNRQGHNPALDPAVELLASWNGQMDQDQAAPFLAALAYQHVRTAMAESAAPGKGLMYNFQVAPAVIERLFRERPPGWFRDYDETLLRALADAVEEGTRMQGRDVKRWRYGAYLSLTVNNPVVHRVPVFGKYFDIGPTEMSGSSTTVRQISRTLGPSMRMDADPGDWERSLLNVPIGQSGQIFSSHYRDQWDHYYSGRSYPMQFRNPQAAGVLEIRPAAR